MEIKLVNGKSPIGETIRAVAKAQSGRLFKPEANTERRSAAVYMVILTNIALALVDLGVSDEQLLDIDPVEVVLAQMIKDGYKVGERLLLVGGVK